VHAAEREGELSLRVLDDGPGFSDDDLRAAGQAFRSAREGGTGLGLAMVRRVAGDLGGRLELARREPAGAEVRLTLPGPARDSVPS
jgi:nitrogen fixation/metabolism regulation signal transduction histidine kinase